MSTNSQLGIGGVPFPGEDLRPKNSVYPRGKNLYQSLNNYY